MIEYANSDALTDSDGNIHGTFNCVYLKQLAAGGKYWSIIDGNTVAADATTQACAQQWLLELRSGTCCAIRTFDSMAYLNLTNNGAILVAGCPPEAATLWGF